MSTRFYTASSPTSSPEFGPTRPSHRAHRTHNYPEAPPIPIGSLSTTGLFINAAVAAAATYATSTFTSQSTTRQIEKALGQLPVPPLIEDAGKRFVQSVQASVIGSAVAGTAFFVLNAVKNALFSTVEKKTSLPAARPGKE